MKTGKLFIYGLIALAFAFLLGIPFMAVGSSLAIVLPFKIDKEGLEGDALKFMNDFEKRLKGVDFDSMSKAEIAKAISDAITASKGEYAGVDFKEVAKLLSADKGVMAILKEQGIQINALKELGISGGKKGITVKEWINSIMDDVKKVYDAGTEGAGRTFQAKAAVIMNSANVTDYSELPDDLIDSFSLGGFVDKRRPREYVWDLASVSTVAEVEKYKIWEEEGSEEGAFAIVAEGALKPLVSLTLVENKSTAAKVAGKIVVTEEFTKWRKKAWTQIQRLARNKMMRDFSAILTTRLLADAAPYTASALDGLYSDPTDYHAVAAVAAQIEALDFMPDMLILNPQDKWRIGMLQDLQGQFYLTIPVTDPSGQTTMMGFTVRTSNRMTVGNFILGESGLWEIEMESIKVKVGYGVTVTGGTDNGGGNVTNVSSDFDNNRFRVILETYFHSYIATNNAGSFVYGNFDAIKDLLTAPI